MTIPIPQATLHSDGIHVSAHYTQSEVWKAVPGRQWDPENRVWVLPNNERTHQILASTFPLQLDGSLQEIVKSQPLEKPQSNVDGLRDDLPIKGVKPFKHQREAYTLALEYDAFAILHEPGCGKSLTTVAIMGRRFLNGQIKRVLIVAPLSVVPVWGKEISQYANYSVQVKALEGSSDKKAQQLKQFGDLALNVAVVNYDSVRNLEEEYTKWRPDMIVCDESQRIKSHDSKQSKVMHKLGRIAKYRLILTGTPIGNSPTDLWSQYKFLNPDIFESSFFAFRNHYAVMGGFERRQIVAYKHLNELTEKAHSIAHRARKADALDLPPYTDQTLYCILEPAAMKAYKQLKRDAVTQLSADQKITAPRIITQMLRLSQMTGGFIRADDDEKVKQISEAKLKLLKETLEDLLVDDDKKVVVFARFIPELHAIGATVQKVLGDKFSYRMIWGDVPGEERGKYVQEFQTNPDVRVFIAQTRTAGLGITLHAADTAIFYSLDYSYMDYEQARARIHRAGQHRPCTAIHLVAQDTIDETVAQALRAKEDIASAIVDKWKEIFN